jgi:hypothetical protein
LRNGFRGLSGTKCLERRSIVIRKVKAKEFVKDMRSGVDDPALMRKYELTDKQLEMVFQKLIDADFITALELWERSRLSDTQITKAFVEAQKAIDELS